MTAMHRHEAESVAAMRAGVAERMAVEQARQYVERHTPIRFPAPPRASQRDSAALVSSPASAALNVAYSFHSTEIAHD